jgi:large subunit ribosomal protein L10
VSLTRQEKETVVAEIVAKVANAKAIVLAEYRGLEVGSMTELRRKARRSGVYLRVLKNTLARRAVKDTPFEPLADEMTGPLLYGFSSDPVATAKVMSEFAKGHDKLVIRAGCMPNAVISAKEVTALASMPSREELLAKLLGTIQAPVAQFVRTLNEVPARFVRVVAAVRDTRERSGG